MKNRGAKKMNDIQKQACVRREIALRKNVYNKRVNEGKMNALQAEYEISCMEDVLKDLEYLEALQKAASANDADAVSELLNELTG
jgi:hypothetical protein